MTFDRMLGALRHHNTKKTQKRKLRQPKHDSRFCIEHLEARVLLNADLAAAAAAQHVVMPPSPPAPVEILSQAPPAPATQSFPAVMTSFGQATGQRAVTINDAAGHTVSFALDGNGLGEVGQTNGEWHVRLTGTDAASVLTIQAQPGVAVNLVHLQADQSVGRISAAGVTGTGTFDVEGTVNAMVIGGIQGGTVRASQIELLTILNDVDHGTLHLGFDDTNGSFNGYRLGVLWIGGSMTSSQVQLAPTTTSRTLGLFSVQGSMSTDSLVAGAMLPTTFISGGTIFPTAGDPRFSSVVPVPTSTTGGTSTPAAAATVAQIDTVPVTTDTTNAVASTETSSASVSQVTSEPVSVAAPEPVTTTSTAVAASLVNVPTEQVVIQNQQVAPPTVSVTAPLVSPAWTATVQRWERDMLQFGRQYGEQLRTSGLQGTYYDAARVFAQIAEYTGDASWYGYVDAALRSYRDGFVLSRNGSVEGYWNFTEGLQMHYNRTGDAMSREAIRLLAQNAAFARDNTPLHYTVSTDYSREVAYSIMSYVNAQQVGLGSRTRLGDLVNQAIGHIDQWFVSGTASYVRPFMVGLTMQALIEAYQVMPDPRITAAVKTALDGLWSRTWVPSAQAFMYTDRVAPDGSGGTNPAADMNLLIAPAFAWMYRMTGDATYLNRGDQVFTGGVEGGFLGSAKHFDQAYLWSFDYLKWRGTV